MLLFFLSAAALIFLIYTAVSVFYPYPLDYGEAPLVDQAMRLAAGQNIYRPDISSPPYTIANYPPLYVLALAPIVGLFGPSFLAGRVISILCALATARFLALTIDGQTKDRKAALATGLIFLAIPYVTHWSSLLRIDLLALALSTAALYLLARWPADRRKMVWAALLLVAAIYTRQSYALAAPLATFAWSWTHDRRRALELAALTSGLALILFLALNILTRGGFFFHIVTANVNEFGLERLAWNLRQLLKATPILLVMAGAFLVLAPGRWPAWSLLVPYLIGSFLSALTIGKIGSNVNYFLELSAALSLVTGAFVAWSRRYTWLRAVILVLLALQTGRLMETTLENHVDSSLATRLGREGAIGDLDRLVARTEGTVLADEYMGLITLQDRPLYIQPFEMTQLARAGRWDQTAFVEGIRNQEFPLVLVYHHPTFAALHEERWTAEMLSALERSYMLADRVADTYVYRPRSSPESASIGPDACPGAPWRLPSRNALGVAWQEDGLDFIGQGPTNRVLVYAVADGLLTRLPDWENRVAILHDDPLRPGQQVWSLYSDMADSAGVSTIVSSFAPGSAGVPVTAGQLLGYQGTWGGRPFWPVWLHVRFALVPAGEEDALFSEAALANLIDPAPYLGIMDRNGAGEGDLRPLKCQE
ncbi:MAG: glycosyltransferase family 39 protein [Chloroflexi bacterium]|nr:glycosyltransferase family 39 protein [Chloroflexota bacterium]MCI0579763.1 glycosyltransferase family 39 protein [Chloroflexota bacterium]MCI0729336.1 glycosyltransferase family 39 protein [Chloroflexota bacterium]